MKVKTYTSVRIPRDQYLLFRQCTAIREKYPDGVPLNREDRKTVLTALRMHPRGREKFGVGIKSVVVGQYISGTRCFFVIRPDGSVEDFSLRKCVGFPTPNRSGRVSEAMARFDYDTIRRSFVEYLKRKAGRS